MKKIIFMIISVLFYSFNAYAYRLIWNLEKDERIEMVKTADVKYYVNARVKRIYEERNIIDITCRDKSEKLNRVHGVFSVHERNEGENVFRLVNRHMVDFLIKPSGKFILKKGDIMPNLRHIPTFPDKDIELNDTWKAAGELVIDNFSKPFKLTFPVEYKLVNIKDDKGSKLAVINYYYSINMNMTGAGYPADFPLKIAGENKGIIEWDIESNKLKNIKDAYQIVFIFATGTKNLASVEFHMNIRTENNLYKKYKPDQKEKEKDDLKKELPSGVDADVDKRGIVVRMNDLLFDFNSSELRSDTREKLDKIADIIKKKYPGREIIVEGHTDNKGEKSYNYSLSEKRAKKVSEYLKSNSGHDKFSYKGYGQDNPLADNSTPEGRQKNRRVEIIIKLD